MIGYEINFKEDNPELSTFHVSRSTFFLLKFSLKSRNLCTDATYKLMRHGFLVFLIGVTDMKRKFSISCNEETKDNEL